MASLLTDLLTSLNVKHTEEYSDKRFEDIPFKTMYGFAKLLEEYGVQSTGVKVSPIKKADALNQFQPPYLLDMPDGIIIITDNDGHNVSYLSEQKKFKVPLLEISDAWNGIALLVHSDPNRFEPDYKLHRIGELAATAKNIILYFIICILSVYAMWAGGLYQSLVSWTIVLLNCVGLWLSVMLVQKSLGIQNKSADAVCSVLEEGGCDELARSEASSFFGIFKWSEVGLSYFSISLLSILMFPETIHALSAINILCLPYTLWSIWYQKFRAKTWCTLCVGVQITIWLLFLAYLLSGITNMISLKSSEFWTSSIILGLSYALMLLLINRIDTGIEKYFKIKGDEN